MEETYTIEEAMIQMIYRELDVTDAMELALEMEDVPELSMRYSDLLNTRNNLPKVEFKPSRAVIDRILNYSATTTYEARP